MSLHVMCSDPEPDATGDACTRGPGLPRPQSYQFEYG
jgi:hypothetical protein